MENKSVITVSSFTDEPFESIDVDVSDSDSWQVIDPSDSDEDNFSYDATTTATDDEDGGDDGVASDVGDLIRHRYGSPSSDVSMQSVGVEIASHCQELEDAVGGSIAGEDDPYEQDEDDYDDDDDGDDVDDDLDDELVPKWLNNRFERQRMRKLGKKVYSKMKKSKRLVNQYSKPGCVHGKHGLGMKHNLIW